jgi:flagellar FliL protein
MSDDVLYEEGDDEGVMALAAPASKSNKKKLIIIVVAVLVLLAAGGGGAAWFLLGKKGGAKPAVAAAEKHEGKEAFVDVPAMLVNLRTSDGNPHYLKVHFMLVAGPNATEQSLKDQIPLVLDAFQPFLRELRPEDLAGSAAVFRIKEELLARTHDALGDGMVDDILIQDLIQQ